MKLFLKLPFAACIINCSPEDGKAKLEKCPFPFPTSIVQVNKKFQSLFTDHDGVVNKFSFGSDLLQHEEDRTKLFDAIRKILFSDDPDAEGSICISNIKTLTRSVSNKEGWHRLLSRNSENFTSTSLEYRAFDWNLTSFPGIDQEKLVMVIGTTSSIAKENCLKDFHSKKRKIVDTQESEYFECFQNSPIAKYWLSGSLIHFHTSPFLFIKAYFFRGRNCYLGE